MKTLPAICTTLVLMLIGCSSEGTDPESAPEPVTPIVEHPEGSALPRGRYAVPFVGLSQEDVEARVEVPGGFEPYNESFLWNGSHDASYALSFWHITGVSPDPCGANPPRYDDPGPSVENVATALHRQPYRSGAAATPVQMAGYEGLYLELTLPKRFDPERCATGHYEAWQARDPEYNLYDRYQYTPGWVDRIWVLDVNGTPLVINAGFDPSITETDLFTLEGMVDSIDIRVAAGAR